MMRTIQSKTSAKDYLALNLIDLSGHATRPFNYRGFYILTKLAGKLFGRNARARLQLSEDSVYEIILRDPYWNRLIHAPFRYEPEISYFLALLQGHQFVFFDGGANWGFWSVLASSQVYGAVETLAYEPMPYAFKRLEHNASINGNRFRVVNSAITPQSGEKVPMAAESNAEASEPGASILPNQEGHREAVYVNATGIDKALAGLCRAEPTVIKLDLEGSEHEVIKSSRWIDNHDCALIFEDHAKDPQCKVSASVMAREWPLYYFHRDGRLEHIESVDHVAALKVVQHRGYNFFGVRPGGLFHKLFAAQKNR